MLCVLETDSDAYSYSCCCCISVVITYTHTKQQRETSRWVLRKCLWKLSRISMDRTPPINYASQVAVCVRWESTVCRVCVTFHCAVVKLDVLGVWWMCTTRGSLRNSCRISVCRLVVRMFKGTRYSAVHTPHKPETDDCINDDSWRFSKRQTFVM